MAGPTMATMDKLFQLSGTADGDVSSICDTNKDADPSTTRATRSRKEGEMEGGDTGRQSVLALT